MDVLWHPVHSPRTVDRGYDITTRAAGYTIHLGKSDRGGYFYGPLLICDQDGNPIATGVWNGEAIEDCEAFLGEAVYQALDEALAVAVARKEGVL